MKIESVRSTKLYQPRGIELKVSLFVFFLSSNFACFSGESLVALATLSANTTATYRQVAEFSQLDIFTGNSSETFNTEKRNSERFICCAARMI